MSPVPPPFENDMKASEEIKTHDPFDNPIFKTIGFPGRMLSGSKLYYSQQHPDSTVYFNACIFDGYKRQIWHGDLDLTLEVDKLQSLANQIGTIHVTPEHPYRFEGFDEGRKRDYENRLVTFEPEAQGK